VTPTVIPGQHWLKVATQRSAQVTAITRTHAIMYWPDTDSQTTVSLDRFNRTREWTQADNYRY